MISEKFPAKLSLNKTLGNRFQIPTFSYTKSKLEKSIYIQFESKGSIKNNFKNHVVGVFFTGTYICLKEIFIKK